MPGLGTKVSFEFADQDGPAVRAFELMAKHGISAVSNKGCNPPAYFCLYTPIHCVLLTALTLTSPDQVGLVDPANNNRLVGVVSNSDLRGCAGKKLQLVGVSAYDFVKVHRAPVLVTALLPGFFLTAHTYRPCPFRCMHFNPRLRQSPLTWLPRFSMCWP